MYTVHTGVSDPTSSFRSLFTSPSLFYVLLRETAANHRYTFPPRAQTDELFPKQTRRFCFNTPVIGITQSFSRMLADARCSRLNKPVTRLSVVSVPRSNQKFWRKTTRVPFKASDTVPIKKYTSISHNNKHTILTKYVRGILLHRTWNKIVRLTSNIEE